jgi:glycosyltransferase involved in cell wall biosynthesis
MPPLPNGTRVLFIESGLYAGGGAQLQLSLLITAVREAGFDASVLTLVEEGPLFDHLLRLGVPAQCVRMRHRADLIRLRRALGYVRLRPQIVVTQSIIATIVGHGIARKVRAPHVVIDHAGPGAGIAVHRRVLGRLVAPHVDCVIAVSKAQIPTLSRIGYRPDQISIIQNAVPELKPSRPAISVRAELGVPAGGFLAVLVASLRPEKAADVFIRAVEEAHWVDSRITGLVVGDGPERARLERVAGDHGAIRLVGHRSDVPDLLGAADTVCLSSMAEASPMALLEAMAVGKPVVATNVGGVPEAVEDEKTGLLVPVGDSHAFASALLRLASDSSLAERMGHAARERHRALFSVDRMVAEYIQLFERMIASSPSRRTA